MHLGAMKPIGVLILGLLHIAPYALVITGGEFIYCGLGWFAAGIMLNIEVNT